MKQAFQDVELKMKKVVDHLHQELKTLRTGRASLSILDSVRVDYFGTPTPINQVANLAVPDATLIIAQPWDSSTIPAIERAILQADLGLNPSSDGKVIRIPVPPLTEERRREIVKRAHDFVEVSRNGIRQARREGNEAMKKLERDKAISQDDERRGHEEIQKLHDHYIGLVNKALETKEKDLMTV
ncbi:MAG TPA: ribosome recycling factor [Thermoanaerobaculia bacterium]|nr:ribosome recycling factor [Thermoanaerobaculia bacterium]